MHTDLTCKNCGTQFGIDDPDSLKNVPEATITANCPKCGVGHTIPWPMGGQPKVNPK